MVLGDTVGATCAQIFSLDAVRAAAAPQCMDLDMHLYYVTLQNLIYGRGNVLQTTTESSNTLPIHCNQYVQQSVNMSNQLPAGLQCDPIQMAEVIQLEYVLVGGSWLYRSVNVANTVHLAKHHSYCLQCQNRGREDRPPEHHLIADDSDK